MQNHRLLAELSNAEATSFNGGCYYPYDYPRQSRSSYRNVVYLATTYNDKPNPGWSDRLSSQPFIL